MSLSILKVLEAFPDLTLEILKDIAAQTPAGPIKSVAKLSGFTDAELADSNLFNRLHLLTVIVSLASGDIERSRK